MPLIRPFRAVRYAPGTDLSLVTAPAYDVVGPEERTELAARHPHNIIRVTLAADQPDDDHRSNKYTRAAETLRSWLAEGVLVTDGEERLHLYRIDYPVGGRLRTTAGIVAALELQPFGDEIAPHERTMPGPKADRLELMRTTRANMEPLWFVAARPLGGIASLASRLEATPPRADLPGMQGMRHRVWDLPADDAAVLTEAAAGVPFVIADGHHRYETALAYREERRATDGPGPWDSTLALVVDPVDHPPALAPIHRLVDPEATSGVVAALPGEPFAGTPADLLEAVAQPGTIGVARRESCWTIPSPGPLDTQFLADEVLAGTPVRYEHNRDRFLEAVSEGWLGFVLAPVPLAQVIEHALAGSRMPPKTTLFWPKPRSGLLLRVFDDR